jgi:subtilisin-like proprotein convertase family protein
VLLVQQARSFEKISKVQFFGINNSSTSTAGYEDFTAIQTDVIQGSTTPVTITLSGGFSSDISYVWIDFNKDGDFVDPGELVFTSAAGTGPHTGNITIPATAPLGTTRMRVRMHDSSLGGNTTPCGTSTYGQVEDYTVNVIPCVPAVFTGQPSSSSIACGGNATFTATASGSLPTFTWEVRTSPTGTWTNVTNGGIYSGATTNVLTLSNVPGTMTGYQYRALMTGACTGVDFSTPATLTVTPLIATVTPTASTICTGSIQKLTLTNLTSIPTYSAPTGLPLTITDASAAGVQSTINVAGIPAGAVVTEVKVTFSLTHTYVGDLDINLIAPNGGNLNLVGSLDNGAGLNSSDDFTNTVISSIGTTNISLAPAPRTATFKAEARPGYGPTGNTQNTAVWTGLTGTLNGNWRLAIADFFTGDVGILTAWKIDILYVSSPLGVWTASPAAPNTMFSDAGATVPYVAGTPATSIWVKPTVSTNYSVVYSTGTPCVSPATVIPVTVANPITGLAVTATRSICVGAGTTFTATTTAGNPLTYQWQVSTDGGANYTDISGETGATLTLSGVTQAMNNNRYRVVATAAPCAGTATSAAGVLTVNPLPTVTLTAPLVALTPGQTTTITTSSTPAASTYVYTLNGTTIAGANTNSVGVNIDQLGNYQVKVTDVNGCVNTSSVLTIGGAASDRLWIYPNPTDGQFQVRLYNTGDPTERREISVYNMSGARVASKTFVLTNANGPYLRMDFDLRAMGAGTYVVKVADHFGKVITSGFVVVQ